MAAFNIFKDKKIDWVTLPIPDGSLSFFQTFKRESEMFWADTSPNPDVYGLQVQQHSKWRQGLTDAELKDLENRMGFIFPTSLANFYKTMNGLTKPGFNLFGSAGTQHSFRPVFYSYPDDIELIEAQIEWIYHATSVRKEELEGLSVSNIFPVCGHRFILIDTPENPVLSIYGDDIIYYTDSLSKLLAHEIFEGAIYNASDFESSLRPEIRFWLD